MFDDMSWLCGVCYYVSMVILSWLLIFSDDGCDDCDVVLMCGVVNMILTNAGGSDMCVVV